MTTALDITPGDRRRDAAVDWFDRHAGLVFLLPPVALVIVMAIFPLLMSLGLAFVYWDFSNPAAGIRWAGGAHWLRLLSDEHFHKVLWTTVRYVVIGVPLQYCIGLVLAVVLNEEIKARNLFRVLFLVPLMLSPVAVSFVVGRLLFNEALGPINQMLQGLGLDPIPWMSSNTLAFLTVILVDTWQWTPFMMLLLLAGLQSIDDEVLEAAELDTVSSWQAFWRVTFPLLLPWTITAILIRSVEMLKIVDLVVVLTNGGPGIATESLTLFAYRTGVVNFDLGYASALAFTLLVLTVVATLGMLFALRRQVARVTS